MENVQSRLMQLSNPEKAKVLQRFFKTGKGEYGEGDVFIGVMVPDSRRVAKEFTNISFENIKKLLQSKIHEERLVGLLILVEKYKQDREGVYKFYIENISRINNWDLVDLTADKIIGDFIKDSDKSILYKLVKSENIWERRISIISTFNFIKNNKFEDALKISEILLNDKHDLIQKAVGWMLREIGKRDLKAEEQFLKKHYKKMPRTTLRYAIERFDDRLKKFYMS